MRAWFTATLPKIVAFVVRQNKLHIVGGTLIFLGLIVLVFSFGSSPVRTALSSNRQKFAATARNEKDIANGRVEGASTDNSEKHNTSTSKKSDKKSAEVKLKESISEKSTANKPAVSATSSNKLHFDTDVVVFSGNKVYTSIMVTADNNVAFNNLKVISTPTNVGASPFDPNDDFSRFTTTMSVNLSRSNPDDSGEGYVQLSATDAKGVVYTGKILVKRLAAPYFFATKGIKVRTDNPDSTATFTFYFTLNPGPNFGNPTIQMDLSAIGCDLKSSVVSRSVVYNGQNEYWLSCTQALENANQSFLFGVHLVSTGAGGGASFTY